RDLAAGIEAHNVHELVRKLPRLPPAAQTVVLGTLLERNDPAVQNQAVVGVRDMEKWTEAVSHLVVPYLEKGMYRCLLWVPFGKHPELNRETKKGPLKERVLRAA